MLAWSWLLPLACAPGPGGPGAASPARALPSGTPGNVLVVLLGGVSARQLPAYGVTANQATTPVIDGLAAGGVRFDAAYGFPSGAAGRAALLTGRSPSRSGIGGDLDPEADTAALPLAEVTLAEAFAGSPYGYASSWVGRWDVTSAMGEGSLFAPLDQGFGWASGSWGDLDRHVDGVLPTSYDRWERVRNGRREVVSAYATTVTVDDALARAGRMPEPWLMVVSFDAPRPPWHLPPPELVHHAPPTRCQGNETWCALLMLEAVDTELGRLLAGLDAGVRARTTIVLTSPTGAAEAGGTFDDDAVRVPLVVSGPWVAPGAASAGLVGAVDLVPTLAALVEAPVPTGHDGAPVAWDGPSFLDSWSDPAAPPPAPRDAWIVSEQFGPAGRAPWSRWDRMVRTPERKIARVSGVWQYWDYTIRGTQGPELLGGGAPDGVFADDFRGVQAEYESAVGPLGYEGP